MRPARCSRRRREGPDRAAGRARAPRSSPPSARAGRWRARGASTCLRRSGRRDRRRLPAGSRASARAGSTRDGNASPGLARRGAKRSCDAAGQRLPESCGDEGADALLVEPGFERRADPALELCAQLVVVAQRRGRERARDEGAATLPRDDEPVALEIAVRLRDRVRVDREIARRPRAPSAAGRRRRSCRGGAPPSPAARSADTSRRRSAGRGGTRSRAHRSTLAP